MDYTSLTSPYLQKTLLELRDEVKPITLGVKPIHSKIIQISEGGGKTRTIAIGDYFTQEALKPLFQETMRFLKSLNTDGTYDQNRAVNKVKQAISENKPIYCLDLKNATDRFPVRIQESVLEAIYGKRLSQSWGRLLTCRNFSHNGKMIRYSVGQPMGFLSSWSCFALSHHAIIQYCGHRSGIHSFSDYTVLGDDVVIFNEQVANKYLHLIKHLGVEISLNKSLTWVHGDRTFPSAEFAKRLI
jgi:hypothetical protein